MSTPKKLRAGTESELTKFKAHWRDTMSESARDYWRSLFVSADKTQAEIRREIHAKLKINLAYDSQLNAFRDWELQQRALDLESERMQEDERRLLEEHPDWTLDQVREDVLKKAYFRARATGDFKLGLATMREDRGLMQAQTDRERFEIEASEKMLSQALRDAAERIASSNLSNADKIAAMRREAFKDVDELQASGRVKIPKA